MPELPEPSESWALIERLFHAALEQPEQSREQFLKDSCGADSGLLLEVKSLLNQHSADDSLLKRPAMAHLGLVTPEWSAGTMVGPYRVVERLGAGGMGEVWKAQDTRLDRSVAIKISASQFSGRFAIEARAVAALNHPNICTLHDVGPNYIVMEFIEGDTLAHRLDKGPLTLDLTLQYGIEIAGAVAAAHARGIIHRDLKPANIMLTASGVKVLDFGLAKFEDSSGTTSATTQSNALFGTIAYMSPEQTEGKPADARSDIFSLGTVLYEAVNGRHPFRRNSDIATLAAILRDDPPPMAGAPAKLAPVIGRCLSKDPDHRFPTAASLQAELAGLKGAFDSDKRGVSAVARSSSRRWMPVSLTAATLLLATAVWWLRPAQPAEEPRAEVLTGYAGAEGQPSLSPDGRKVAFHWNGERQNNFDIYVKQIGSSGPPLRLTTNPAPEVAPSWSPDDRWIAFFRKTSNKMKLLVMPSLGGPERELADLVFGVSGISWTPDAKWLVYAGTEVGDGPSNIWAVSVGSGERRRLTTWTHPQGVGSGVKFVGDTWPAVAPDGRTLAFSRSKGSFVTELYSMPLGMDVRPGGPAVRIVDHLCSIIMGIAWTTDGRDLVFGCGTEIVFGLWRTSVSGRSNPRRLTYALPSAGNPSIAHGTPRLAYSWTFSNSNLWRLDTRSKERQMLIGSTQGHNRTPYYSRDGRKIAFQSSRNGDAEIWTCDAEGTNCQQLTNFRGTLGGAPRWSPDGHWLAFDSRAEGQAEIYVMRADGGASRRLTSHPANDVTPSWSHDGRWIYFTSNRTGRHEIWKTPAEGGDAVQVTRAGGYSVLESPDGKLLFFTKSFNDPKDTLFSMPVEGGEETNLAINVGHWASFGVTSKGIYFVQDRFSIRFFDFATGKVSTLATSDKLMLGLTVSPDGAFVVVSQFDRNDQDLMLVENFR